MQLFLRVNPHLLYGVFFRLAKGCVLLMLIVDCFPFLCSHTSVYLPFNPIEKAQKETTVKDHSISLNAKFAPDLTSSFIDRKIISMKFKREPIFRGKEAEIIINLINPKDSLRHHFVFCFRCCEIIAKKNTNKTA